MHIEQPHGYLLDEEGRVVSRFGGWRVGEHDVPEAVEDVEYVDGPAVHDKAKHWMHDDGRPTVAFDCDVDEIANDGEDEATITMQLHEDATEDVEAELVIDGDRFGETLTPGEEVEDPIVTTADAGETITVALEGEEIQDPDPVTLEVVDDE